MHIQKPDRLLGDLCLARAYGFSGGEIWPAARVLCEYLDHNHGQDLDNFDCIELGAGTGAVGIFAAAALGCNVTLTDHKPPVPGMSDRLLEVLRDNVKMNKSLYPTRIPRVVELDIEKDKTIEEAALSSRSGGGYDLVLVSDVTDATCLHKPLAHAIAKLLWQESPDSRCLLAHEERVLNADGQDYQLLEFEEALAEAQLQVVKESTHTLEDADQEEHKICILEIQSIDRAVDQAWRGAIDP